MSNASSHWSNTGSAGTPSVAVGGNPYPEFGSRGSESKSGEEADPVHRRPTGAPSPAGPPPSGRGGPGRGSRQRRNRTRSPPKGSVRPADPRCGAPERGRGGRPEGGAGPPG